MESVKTRAWEGFKRKGFYRTCCWEPDIVKKHSWFWRKFLFCGFFSMPQKSRGHCSYLVPELFRWFNRISRNHYQIDLCCMCEGRNAMQWILKHNENEYTKMHFWTLWRCPRRCTFIIFAMALALTEKTQHHAHRLCLTKFNCRAEFLEWGQTRTWLKIGVVGIHNT